MINMEEKVYFQVLSKITMNNNLIKSKMLNLMMKMILILVIIFMSFLFLIMEIKEKIKRERIEIILIKIISHLKLHNKFSKISLGKKKIIYLFIFFYLLFNFILFYLLFKFLYY